jgi:sialic acid synthase SpsE
VASSLEADAYFIHPSSINDIEFIEKIAETGKPILLGDGAVELKELENAVYAIKKINDKIIIMHGFQAYPTKTEDTNFLQIKTLQNKFSLPIGFQDHIDAESELSIIIPLMSITAGACVIEKHITIDRKLKLTDYESALEPIELKKFENLLRITEKALGKSEFIFSKDEKKYRENVQKSIVADKAIAKGTKIERDMIAFKRTSPSGISPKELYKLLGKKAKINIEKNENIFTEMLE